MGRGKGPHALAENGQRFILGRRMLLQVPDQGAGVFNDAFQARLSLAPAIPPVVKGNQTESFKSQKIGPQNMRGHVLGVAVEMNDRNPPVRTPLGRRNMPAGQQPGRSLKLQRFVHQSPAVGSEVLYGVWIKTVSFGYNQSHISPGSPVRVGLLIIRPSPGNVKWLFWPRNCYPREKRHARTNRPGSPYGGG